MMRALILGVAALTLQALPAAGWTIGPFAEYDDEADLIAVRPLFAAAERAREGGSVTEVIWPVSAFHHDRNRSWWRILTAWGDDRQEDVSWSWCIFPLWFNGVTRQDDYYWGLFPIYGEHPHFLTMDDWQFVLWPLWQAYDIKGVRKRSVIWPIFSWKDAPRKGFGVWPLFGKGTQRESEHYYILWPFATWAIYQEDRDTGGIGSSWMYWPFCGGVRRARESQFLILPPFFSYAETPQTRRWRLPWPLVDVELGVRRHRVSVWPFYEHIEAFPYGNPTPGRTRPSREVVPQEETYRFLWLFVENTKLTTPVSHETRFSIFPFFTHEERDVRDEKGGVSHHTSFWRVWPFYRYESADGNSRLRVLDLLPIRHAEPIDRNWSPFWTLFMREDSK